MRKLLILVISLAIAFGLSACQQKENQNTIKVGVIAGPETELLEVAKETAKKNYGLDIKIIQFTDYVMPNEALADGSIDANMFQHVPYLEAAIKSKGYRLAVVGKTFIYPMGIYSKKIKAIDQLPEGATVAVPNDPSNETRALLLLQRAGLIKLKPPVNNLLTLQDITENPKNIKIKELDAAQLPRVLNDVDLAAINTNYAMVSGLLPSRDALFIENSDSPYANVLVVREGDQNKKQFQELLQAIQSQAVINKANQLFQDQAIAAWEKS